MNHYTTLAQQLATTSQTILREAFRQSTHKLKTDASPVTQADKDVEQALRKLIITTYPTHGIFGEEYGAHNPDADYQWIIDPIDGTRAFACGIPSFGTLIGLRYHDDMLLGILNQPILQECWIGAQGEATMLNGAAIRTSATTTPSQAKIATTSPYLFSPQEKQQFDTLAKACAIQSFGGDCYNYGLLAAGHLDIIMEAGLKPYDILPLLPILHGAGAHITDWGGHAINTHAATINILVSANQSLHEQALGIINAA